MKVTDELEAVIKDCIEDLEAVIKDIGIHADLGAFLWSYHHKIFLKKVKGYDTTVSVWYVLEKKILLCRSALLHY